MNVEKYLHNIFKNIIAISKLFDKIVVIFGYDNSSDSSLEHLLLFKQQKESEYFIVDILINKMIRHKHRTHNLEYIRNLMATHMYKIYPSYDYFIMMDSDDVCSTPINTDVLHKHLKNNISWDALSSNRPDYYDIWALQYDDFIFHCRGFSTSNYYVVRYMKHHITNILNNTSDYFPVYSAFNGFAIYKLNKFTDCRYDGVTQKYSDDDKINTMIMTIANGYYRGCFIWRLISFFII
jgi:hypothetical protein